MAQLDLSDRVMVTGQCSGSFSVRVAAPAQQWLAVCLAMIAGYVDAYGLRAFATYVSFMSGNTTQTGSMIGQGNLVAALPSALAIVLFVAGSFAGTWLTHAGLRHSRQILFGTVAALLAATIGVMQPGSFDAKAGIATLSLAMGVMNTTLSHVGAQSVNVTFVTGTLYQFGTHIALAIKRVPLPDAQGLWDTHQRRAFLLAGIWAGFLIGALLAGAATSHFGGWVLLLPVLILLGLAAFSRGQGDDSAFGQSCCDRDGASRVTRMGAVRFFA